MPALPARVLKQATPSTAHWRDAWVFSLYITHISLGLGPQGEDILGESACILATNRAGDRYLHFHTFLLHRRVKDAQGRVVRAVENPSQRAQAESFLRCVEKTAARGQWPGPRSNAHWSYIDACDVIDPAAPMLHDLDDFDLPADRDYASDLVAQLDAAFSPD